MKRDMASLCVGRSRLAALLMVAVGIERRMRRHTTDCRHANRFSAYHPRTPTEHPIMRLRFVLVLLAATGAALGAQPSAGTQSTNASVPLRGAATFLYAYRPKPGQEAAFAAGYKRHLDWHRQHRDSLTWLGWTIVGGERLDAFVNGVFGVPFKAMDVRVDASADGQDAARNVNAYADPILRDVYRLRPDLGTSRQLEEGRPAAMQHVARIKVLPGKEAEFERALSGMTKYGDASKGQDRAWAVYELVSGGDDATYMLVVQLAGWAALEDVSTDPVRTLLRAASASIARVRSETWQYEPELSYLPR